jgi:hypothetical protein
LLPRLTTEFTESLGALAFMYVKASVYALLMTFVVHLASRAYWVALVGLDSVFPGGIRWDRARSYGPVAEQLIRDRVRPLPHVISRLDNFCSVAFAVGFAAVSAVLLILVLLLTVAGLTWAVAKVFVGGGHLELVFLAWVAVLALPVLALFLDRWVGNRLRPGGPGAAALRGLLRLSPRLLLLRVLGPIHLTLATNLGGRRLRLLTFALLLASIGIAFTQLQESRKGATLRVYSGLPPGLREQAAQYRHYADQRSGSDAFAAVPFIQSDIVRDPYVRLFIPYVPARDAYELASCRRARAAQAGRTVAGGTAAGVRAPAAPTAEEAAILCLGTIYDVKLDGHRVAGVDYRFYTDPTSGLQGLLGYIPTMGLPRGGNVLLVRRPRPDGDAGTPAPAPFVVPFWL